MFNRSFRALKTALSNLDSKVVIPAALRITGIYVVVGFLWIFSSDRLLSLLFYPSSHRLTNLQTLKGWFYVTMTAGLLYWLISREMRANQQVNRRLRETLVDLLTAQEALQHSEEQLRLALDFTQIGSWDWDLRTNKLTWNQNHFYLLGLDPNTVEASYQAWYDRLYPDDLEQVSTALNEALKQGNTYEAEYRVIYPDGTLHWVIGKGRAVYDELGQPIRMIGILLDDTERKQAEERAKQELIERQQAETQLRATLAEKEILLKEIHHRVKNNLQIVSGLLQLQAQGFKDAQIVGALRESQNRIDSISLIHKQLYAADFGQVNAADYIQSLATSLIATYQISSSKVSLKVLVEPVLLSLDQAIPCGLIINELMSNALKYAFPDYCAGEIKVKLAIVNDSAGNELFELVIQDNGVGLPTTLDWQDASSLGLSLVYALATDQLEGSLTVDRHQGTTFIIHFPRMTATT